MVGPPGLVEHPHRAEQIWWLTLVVKLTYREGGFSVEELRTRDWLVGMPMEQFLGIDGARSGLLWLVPPLGGRIYLVRFLLLR